LLVFQGLDSIPQELKTAALATLKPWKAAYRGAFAEQVSERCIDQLKDGLYVPLSPPPPIMTNRGGSQMRSMARMMKQRMQAPINECGGLTCQLIVDSSGIEMKACGKYV
jgi:hypothetical protein